MASGDNWGWKGDVMSGRERSLLGAARLLLVVVLAAGLAVAVPASSGAADGNETPGAPSAFRAIAAGGGHTCALLNNGSVRCWGGNGSGQLGQGDTVQRGDQPGEMGDNLPAVDLGIGGTATAIAAGANHTCALLDDGTVKCWGYNQFGQLGLGDTNDRGDRAGEMGDNLPAVGLGAGRTAAAISAGATHTCALLDDGTIKCWGNNGGNDGGFGQLGLGDGDDRGDQPGEMGDFLPAVGLGAGRTAAAISAGATHTCALLDNATVKCWGGNGSGQLGQGDTVQRGDQPGEMGDNLPAVSLGTGRTATAVTSGQHTCALLDNASVKCWGPGGGGLLGLGNSVSRGDGPHEMGDFLPAVSLGTGRTAAVVTAGLQHTCALLDNATVKCWGTNDWGELGLGDTLSRGDGVNEMGDNLPSVNVGTGRTATAVAAGTGSHTCALLDNTTLKCWGRNFAGQLGLGDTVSRGDQTGEMGDNLPAVDLATPALPSMTVSIGADETSVVMGSTVHLHVIVTNTGNVALHNVTVTDEYASSCDHNIGTLAVGAETTVVCTHTATAGDVPTFSSTVAVDSDETDPVVSNQVDVGVTIPSGSGLVAGTVAETGAGEVIGGALVAMLSGSDFSFVVGSTADVTGAYTAAVPAGDYYVYAIDPTGDHTAGFLGAPTIVTVAAGEIVNADPRMTPRRGSIAGMVTDAGSGDPITQGLFVGLNAPTGQPERGATTNGSGGYSLAGVPVGVHMGLFVDLTGAHSPQFWNEQTGPNTANPITVNGGATTSGVDAALAAQTPPAGSAHLTGEVTSTNGGGPLEGVAVMALHASTYGIVAGDLTDAAGHYDIPVDPGGYKLVFYDPTGSHQTEWHDNLPYNQIAAAVTVTPTVASPIKHRNAGLTPSAGTVTGIVTGSGSTNPIAGAWAIAVGSIGTVVTATTNASGVYTIAGLAPGTYRAGFADPTGTHRIEYWDDSPDFGGSDAYTITAGGVTSGIDANLARH